MAAATLPAPEQAYQHLFANVKSTVFFHKLAQAGIPVRTENDANELLKLAGTLRTVAQDPAIKQAEATTSPYAMANSALSRVLQVNGLDGQQKAAAAQEQMISRSQVAAQLLQDPDIYNSVLSLKAAEAQAMAT